MALSFDACLLQQGSGTNEIYGDCCCTITCAITTDSSIRIDDLVTFFTMESFSLISAKFYINNVNQALPLNLAANESVDLELQICASSAGNSDSLSLDFILGGGGSEQFNFDFISVDLSTSVNVSSINFGTVTIGSTISVPVTISNPTTCCYSYDFTSSCAEVTTTSNQTAKLCNSEGQTIGVVYTPTTAGELVCSVMFANECQSFEIPITATAVASPSSGSSNGQKNKVDQTSVLPACSPRTINNQCNTGQAARAAITSRAQTITRPSGGAGRGKGFSK